MTEHTAGITLTTIPWAYIAADPGEWFGEFDPVLHERLIRDHEIGTIVELPDGAEELLTTGGEEPTSLQHDPFGIGEWDTFNTGRNEMIVLRLKPVGGRKYSIAAVHLLADAYAVPGTPLRAVLDGFCGSSTGWRTQMFFANGEGVDGFGEPVYEVDDYGTCVHSKKYGRACLAAEWAAMKIQDAEGAGRRFPASCTTPTELFHALIARGSWGDDWTADEYRRIAGRYERVFGGKLHPDD